MSTTAAVPSTQHAGVIERYTFKERLMHWFTGGTYLYCLATGLAFYSPHLYWLAYMLGGAPTSRFWHPILACVSDRHIMDEQPLAARYGDHRGGQALAESDRGVHHQ